MAHTRVLVVESDRHLREQLLRSARAHADAEGAAGLPTARTRLLTRGYDWLVTNIRLDAYNGLHLAYLAGVAGGPSKVLVYDERLDLLLAREAQRLGAFYETRATVVRALPRYLTLPLPDIDRRNPACRDRRDVFRGGRRSYDVVRAVDWSGV